MTRQEAIIIIKDHYGMCLDLLRDTILNDLNSTNTDDYSDLDLVCFARFQQVLSNSYAESA